MKYEHNPCSTSRSALSTPNVQALVDLSGFMAGILGLQFKHFCYTYIRCSCPGRLCDHKVVPLSFECCLYIQAMHTIRISECQTSRINIV